MGFSIIMPFFNASDFIGNALSSITNQTYRGDYEILLVDDCSTDNSWDLANEFCSQNNNAILLKTDKNSGPGIARNMALRLASKDYVVFLDSDDTLHPNALLSLDSTIKDNADVDCVIYKYGGGGGGQLALI